MAILTAYSSSQYLFDRDWSVAIQPFTQTGLDLYKNPVYGPKGGAPSLLFARQGQNQINQNTSFTNLRVTFDFEKTNQSSSNVGKVEVWNLNDQTRKAIQRGARVTLKAGYTRLMKPIWVADVLDNGVKIERRENDVVTTFTAASSGRNLQQNIFVKNYPDGTTLFTLIRDLAAAMDVSESQLIGITEADDRFYNSCLSFCGTVKNCLDRILTPAKFQWNIDNETLRIYPVGASVQTKAILLASGENPNSGTTGLGASQFSDQNTGLLGIPSYAVQGGVASFSCLLNPDIYPGQLVQLISRSVNGFFIISKAKYKGDSHGKEWNIDCESYVQNGVQSQVQSAFAGTGIA